MSTYWYLRCTEHGEETENGVNHGEGLLRYVAGLREPLATLMDADVEHELDIGSVLIGSEPLWFVRKHVRCPLELRSEYGGVEPIDKRCEATLPGYTVEPHQCERQADHGGRHHATLDRFRATADWQ